MRLPHPARLDTSTCACAYPNQPGIMTIAAARAWFLGTLLASSAAFLECVSGQTLSVGERIRVTAPSDGFRREVGTLLLETPDSISVEFPGRYGVIRTFARSELTQMQVSVGTKRTIRKGLLIGTSVGLIVGAVGHGIATGGEGWGPSAFALAIPLGPLVGLAAGMINRADVWRDAR
jgi:hypothetical protein